MKKMALLTALAIIAVQLGSDELGAATQIGQPRLPRLSAEDLAILDGGYAVLDEDTGYPILMEDGSGYILMER